MKTIRKLIYCLKNKYNKDWIIVLFFIIYAFVVIFIQIGFFIFLGNVKYETLFAPTWIGILEFLVIIFRMGMLAG